jgi:hypothetical protein
MQTGLQLRFTVQGGEDKFRVSSRQFFHNRALGSRIRLDANAIIDG